MTEPGPVDLSIISELREIGDVHVQELVDTFQQDVKRHIATMKEAIKKKEYESLNHAVHTLKGSSGSMGARELPKICFEIEKSIKSGRLDGISEKLQQLEEECRRVRDVLDKEKDKPS